MDIFYTWKDLERWSKKQRNKFKSIAFLEFYPDEVVIYKKEGYTDKEVLNELAEEIPKNVDIEEKVIRLDSGSHSLMISFEEDWNGSEEMMVPLFEKIIYRDSAYPSTELAKLSCPVIAFHSYKGGVGRTLSLLAFARAWTAAHADTGKEKLLIVDSDLEAPGLTWLQGSEEEYGFSYLDLLTMIQDEEDIDWIVDVTVKNMGNRMLPIETDNERVDHLFLPTSRYDEQLLDLYATPWSVTRCKNKEYVLAEVLSKIAIKTGASAVLVDLRAGISEYSAPLLFDPRVKKYFVTSTSYQSVVGTKKLLRYAAKGLNLTDDANLPQIFLSKIPQSLSVSEKEKIIGEFNSCFNTDENNEQLLDNLVVELPFASELIHLEQLPQILSALKGRDMYIAIEKLVRHDYAVVEKESYEYTEEEWREYVEKIHTFANKQITAESNSAADLLLTQPIKSLCSRYKGRIPTAVVRGAKGSGKTFLYRKLLENKEWYSFCSGTLGVNENIAADGKKAYFLPIIANRNSGKMKELLEENINAINDEISSADISKSVYIDSIEILEKAGSDVTTDWMKFYERFFAQALNQKFQDLSEADKSLKKDGSSIVYIIDGLEEIFKNVPSNENQQRAVQFLCQDFVNKLAIRYENIGIIIFIRSDMVENAITTNYEQFKQSYDYAELKWTSDEALRLVVWLVSQSIKGFYKEQKPIESISKDIINEYLEKIWGMKLGKNSSNEAYSSRWILAALSDFNGQLQARDIIRFLYCATEQVGKRSFYYNDRILMPKEVRDAVSSCSKEKIKEIKTEYEQLKPILEKLESIPTEKKVLPLELDEELSPTEEKMMTQQGYMTRADGKLYLPEIIRHALGFHYVKGARPKVLSLLLKK